MFAPADVLKALQRDSDEGEVAPGGDVEIVAQWFRGLCQQLQLALPDATKSYSLKWFSGQGTDERPVFCVHQSFDDDYVGKRFIHVLVVHDGCVSHVQVSDIVNLAPIKGMCELQPIVPALFQMDAETGALMLGDQEVRVRFLGGVPNLSHSAFALDTEAASLSQAIRQLRFDQFIRMPAYDRDGLLAIVGNRFAWGSNVTFGYVDVVRCTLWLWYSWNDDMPPGYALRTTDNGLGLELFLDCSDRSAAFAYKHPTMQLATCNHGIHDIQQPQSRWIKLHPDVHFPDLLQVVRYAENHPSFTTLDAFYEDLEQGMHDLYKAERYEEALHVAQKAFDGPLADKASGFLGVKRLANATYNCACMHALLGRKEKAMATLLDYEQRWPDTMSSNIARDKDLVSLHQEPEFLSLLARHSMSIGADSEEDGEDEVASEVDGESD